MQEVHAVVKTTISKDRETVEILSVHTDRNKAHLELLSAAEYYHEHHEVLTDREQEKYFRQDDTTARIRLEVLSSHLWR